MLTLHVVDRLARVHPERRSTVMEGHLIPTRLRASELRRSESELFNLVAEVVAEELLGRGLRVRHRYQSY